MRHAAPGAALTQGDGPPKDAKSTEKPVPQVEEYVTSAVPIVRTEPTAEDSLAAIFERSKFGMAMAAMIRMIATTISNSIREKPFCFFMRLNLLGSLLCAKRMVLRAREVPLFAVSRSRFPNNLRHLDSLTYL